MTGAPRFNIACATTFTPAPTDTSVLTRDALISDPVNLF